MGDWKAACPLCAGRGDMTNDVVRLAIDRAVKRFGDKGDGLFNAAGFGIELMKLAGLNGSVDGLLVRAMLTGRPDVMPEPDGAHYRRSATIRGTP